MNNPGSILLARTDKKKKVAALAALNCNNDVIDPEAAIVDTHSHIQTFNLFVKCLSLLVAELPKQTLGKFVSLI